MKLIGIRRCDEKGASMVEVAIILPVVLLLTLGTLLFSQFLLRKIIFSRATAVAARDAAIASSDVEQIARDSFYQYLGTLNMERNASITVTTRNVNGLCSLEITGVSGRWCTLCESYLGIGLVSSRRLIPIEEPTCS